MQEISRRVFGKGLLALGAANVFCPEAEALERLSTIERTRYAGRYPATLIAEDDGRILRARNIDQYFYPASLMKVASMMVVFDALRAGKIKLDDMIEITAEITELVGDEEWRPSRFVGVKEMSVDEAIHLAVIKSMNEPMIALACHIAGDEQSFAALVEAKLRSIGCNDTTVRNSNGYDHPEQKTTPMDMLKAMQHMRFAYAEESQVFGLRSFRDSSGEKQKTNNRFLLYYPYAKIAKTGSTDDAGCHNDGYAEHNGKGVFVLTMGAPYARYAADANHRMSDIGIARYGRAMEGLEAPRSSEERAKVIAALSDPSPNPFIQRPRQPDIVPFVNEFQRDLVNGLNAVIP